MARSTLLHRLLSTHKSGRSLRQRSCATERPDPLPILFIFQTYTGFSMAWATPDTIATIIGLVTPVLVWAIPNKKVA